jgi:hypothetical protein
VHKLPGFATLLCNVHGLAHGHERSSPAAHGRAPASPAGNFFSGRYLSAERILFCVWLIGCIATAPYFCEYTGRRNGKTGPASVLPLNLFSKIHMFFSMSLLSGKENEKISSGNTQSTVNICDFIKIFYLLLIGIKIKKAKHDYTLFFQPQCRHLHRVYGFSLAYIQLTNGGSYISSTTEWA